MRSRKKSGRAGAGIVTQVRMMTGRGEKSVAGAQCVVGMVASASAADFRGGVT
jgi:hypothetical protein